MVTEEIAQTPVIDTPAEPEAPAVDNDALPVSDADSQPNADAATDNAEPDASQEESPVYEDGKAYAEAKRKERKGREPEAEQQQSRVDPNAVAQAMQTYQANLDARYKAVDELNIEEYNLYTEAGQKKLREDLKQFINSTHADGLKYAAFEAAQNASLSVVESVQQGLAGATTEDGAKAVMEQLNALATEGKPVTWADYHRLVKDHVITEYRESKEYLDEIAQTYDDGRAAGERTKEAAQSGKTPRGAATGASSKTFTKEQIQNASPHQVAEWLADPDLAPLVNAALAGQ